MFDKENFTEKIPCTHPSTNDSKRKREVKNTFNYIANKSISIKRSLS